MIELNGVTIGFAVFSILTLGGGLGVVLNRNLFRGTVWLMVSLFGIAGLFVLLSAPFLAAIQVLVYIGAIAILFTFAVMLTRSLTNIQMRFYRAGFTAVASAVLFVLLIVGVIMPVWGGESVLVENVAGTTELGKQLVSGNGYVIPFEVASILLTAAMIGAIVIARDED